MKVVVICNSDILALPAVLRLQQKGDLVAVVVPRSAESSLFPLFEGCGIPAFNLFSLTKENLESGLLDLIGKTKPDCLFSITFPWKIPGSVLSAVGNRCFNFHFGTLPKYKGADPVFWQLKNREAFGALTVHLMTEYLDEGPVVFTKPLSSIPGETYGIHCQRLGYLAAEVLGSVQEKISEFAADEMIIPSPQEPLFLKPPASADLTINWEQQSADEIEALVNAANPRYGGAVTYIKQRQVGLLEVSPADVNAGNTQATPGTIIYADGLYGPIVACINNQFLKLNVFKLPEGYLSGVKFLALGHQVGDVFHGVYLPPKFFSN